MNVAKKKHEMPSWFPFALAASFFGILGAGALSKWRLSGDQPKPKPATPPGALQDWFGG